MEWIKSKNIKNRYVLSLAVCDVVIIQYAKEQTYYIEIIGMLSTPLIPLDTSDLEIAKKRAVVRTKSYLKNRFNLIKESIKELEDIKQCS